MTIQRIALIFDDRLRPDTTGVYCRRALAELVDVVHFHPDQRDQIPSTGFDLYLSIDDDTDQRLPANLGPRAYWAIDTHLDFAARVARSRSCDIVFAAQGDGAERLRAAGIESATWLPLACDPAVHRKHDMTKQYDISFVGRFCPGPRNDLLDVLRGKFPSHLIGQAYFEEMARIYSASRIVFNRSIRNDVNMRVFEAVACGSLLVTNDLAGNGQEELFQDGGHLATYRDPDELLEKIAYYLVHEDEREAIAAAGRAEALARHTYRHRMEQLLAHVEASLPRRVMAVGALANNATAPLPEPMRPEQRGMSVVRRTEQVAGMASIIVPCWNQLDFTRQCMTALMRNTREPWELIVVNNGSTDGTADYLSGLQAGGRVPVTVIANAVNRGFPAAINQGLHFARGEYLVLLNNDVVVTDGWLDQLVALATAKTGSIAETARDYANHEDDGLTAKNAKDAEGEKPGSDFNAETGEAKTETENSNLTITDFNEVRAERPPPYPPPQGGREPLPPSLARGEDRHSIGLVGPMSNYAAPPQLVEGVPYRDLEEMHGFARRWRDEHRGKWFTVPKLSGFCLLMKRAVYEKIGGLDERFGIGFFDDDDLAERARRAGFELAVAHDLFVHHFGSRTFLGNGIDAEKLLDENARRFAAKWGLPQTRGHRVALRPFTGRPPMTRNQAQDGSGPRNQTGDGSAPPITPINADENTGLSIASHSQTHTTDDFLNGSLSVVSPFSHVSSSASSADENLPPRTISASSAARKVRVSLTMIVRNEENNLPHCLESVAGLFDEIVVVDTGSTDRTIEIARSFGARVFDFVWVDDFGAARNAALARATGDYVFWLDADDVVDPPERKKLKGLFDRLRPDDEACYVVRCKCDPSADGSGGDTVVDHLRLFPLREDVRWTYRVHEQIVPALNRAGVPVRWPGITVRHTGYVDKELRGRKLDRDVKILREDLEDHPHEPFILFNLGAIAIERENWLEALEFLKRSLARSAPTDSITKKLFALIARAHQMLENYEAALRVCAEGLKYASDDAELWFRKAVVHRRRGEPAQAERCWRRILTLSRPEQFSSVDQGIYGHWTRRNLAALARERGDHAEAQRLWKEVLVECPGDQEAMAKLSLVLGP